MTISPRTMGFFTALTNAMSSRQSLLITGLDPNPEMCATGQAIEA